MYLVVLHQTWTRTKENKPFHWILLFVQRRKEKMTKKNWTKNRKVIDFAFQVEMIMICNRKQFRYRVSVPFCFPILFILFCLTLINSLPSSSPPCDNNQIGFFFPWIFDQRDFTHSTEKQQILFRVLTFWRNLNRERNAPCQSESDGRKEISF